MIAEGLVAHLESNLGVSAIVGTRIYPQMIPQHVYDEATKQPCIIYTLVSSVRQPLFCRTDRVVEQFVQLDCYAKSFPQVRDLAAATRAALIDFSGSMGSVTVKKVLHDGEIPGLEPEPGLYRLGDFYRVWFVDPI